jgi:hypothetical protein
LGTRNTGFDRTQASPRNLSVYGIGSERFLTLHNGFGAELLDLLKLFHAGSQLRIPHRDTWLLLKVF